MRRLLAMCVLMVGFASAPSPAQDAREVFAVSSVGTIEGLSGEALTAEEVLALRVLLVRVDGVLVSPAEVGEDEADAPGVILSIGELAGERLSVGAIRAALEAIPASYAARGYRGILVSVDEAALGKGVLTLSFVEGRVGEVRTVLRREGREAAVNDPRAERFRIGAPVRSGSPESPGGLIDVASLDGYAHFLSRRPNRRADIALAPGPTSGREGDVTLDILLTESSPFLIYAQASNTGTEQTSEWRERFGLAHYDLTGNDDTLTLDYITGSFDEVHAVLGSYEAPLGLGGRLRGRVFGRYSRYDASELGALLVDFRGENASAGAELIWNVYQRGPAFLDLVAGVRFEYHEVQNSLGIDANNTFVLPSIGARFERRSDAWSLDASLSLEFNWSGVAGTDAQDLDRLGRFDADEDFAVFVYDVNWSAYIDALFGERSSRIHEVALGVRGRASVDSRLAPGFTDVAGGFYTVRGHPEAFTSGDRSVIASAEYRFHLPRALSAYDDGEGPGEFLGEDFHWRPAQRGGLAGWDLVLRAFVDVGWVGNVDALPFENDETLIGAGVGVEVSFGRTFRGRLDWGWVLRDAESANDRVESGDNEAHLVFTLVF